MWDVEALVIPTVDSQPAVSAVVLDAARAWHAAKPQDAEADEKFRKETKPGSDRQVFHRNA